MNNTIHMLVRDRKSEMLAEFNKCEFSDNDPIEQKQIAINRIASQHLSELLDEEERKNLGELTHESFEKCMDEIANITNDVLSETIGSISLPMLKEQIIDYYTNN